MLTAKEQMQRMVQPTNFYIDPENLVGWFVLSTSCPAARLLWWQNIEISDWRYPSSPAAYKQV